MRDAARLMLKVFAVVFGAGGAAVVLTYLLLGAYFLYGRINRFNQSKSGNTEQYSAASGGGYSVPSIFLYDPNAIPKGAVVPDAQLNCRWSNPPPPKGYVLDTCAVLVGGRLAAFISRDQARQVLDSQ